MRTIYLVLFALSVCSFAANKASAQITAPFAVGVRGTPDGGGLNLRYYFSENFGLEGQANYSVGTPGGSGKATTGVVLAEYHILFWDARLRMFLGAGAHYGSWERYRYSGNSEGLFGFDGILGAEYVFPSVPLGVSLDVKPAFDFISGVTALPANNVGLSLRFYFGAWEDYDSNVEDRRE
jgi:hypothetical protein